MADIVKRNAGQMAEWDPLRAMRDLLRWDPFREMAPMLSSLERVPIGSAFAPSFAPSFMPSFDVTETKDAYVFKADVPGVKLDELEITTTGNRLQISGRRENEHETRHDNVYAYERQFGTFTRAFTLPDDADIEHARSELKDGVLTLVVPKRAGAMPKKIAISAGESKS